MAIQKLNLSRDQLASFLQDFEQIKQFENLFSTVDTISTVTIDEIGIAADSAFATANEALSGIATLNDLVAPLVVAPPPTGGTVTSVDASGGSTGLTLTGGPITTSGTITLGGTLDVNNGGTGQTSYTNGQLLIGNTTGNTLTPATLTAGTNVTITDGPGSITINATDAFAGTVTSVSVVSANGFAGTVATATTTPAITMSTSITGVIKGNGTAISAATAGTDYVAPGAYTTSGLTMATSRLLGRTTASTGAAEEISVAGGLTLSGGVLTGSSGTVTSVTGTAPVASSGGNTPVISMAAASTTVDGYLTAANFTIFNNKGSGSVTSVGQTFTGGLISVAGSPITGSGTLALTVAGTSGGVPYFTSASTWATSAALAANAIVLGGGAGVAPATTTTGTGVVTALGVAVGSAGAFVTFNGALGTPSSGTVTNLTGTASININGTVGATTAAAGAFTTITGSTSLTTPLFSGGTAVSSTLTLQSTSGAGTSDAIIFNTASQTERMRIDTIGNVGIGTSAPATRLHVAGTGSGPTLRLENQTATTGKTYEIISGNGGPLRFQDITAGAERMRITSAGDVGIGVTNPGYTLAVNGAIACISATSGLGYGTGSGGAVTQITSRTTGVTLDKPNGAITLVSAAGSVTYQSFTVTNSTVAATDTVIVSQKSGTDLNMIFVTAVAAGSFRISFATTGGTTTEQPVFNFAVIKAVAA